MSKKQAKTASKNNPSSRVAVKKYFYQGTDEVKPSKIVSNTTFMGAEYIKNGEILKDSLGIIMSWKAVTSKCTLK